uniref:Synaptotagmin-like protein 1 n=1 Tax=Xenopus tropicalis TaxID=8364 RepID=A0A6I8RZY5_XENTR
MIPCGETMDLGENGDLLDLSFLTGEEQLMIVQVLERDTELKAKEDQRIKKLRSTLPDKKAFKRLSGEWFCDVRATRPWGQTGGVDIVRASIRRKKKVRGECDINWDQDENEEREGPEETCAPDWSSSKEDVGGDTTDGKNSMEDINLSPVNGTITSGDTNGEILEGKENLNDSPPVPRLTNNSISGSMISLFSTGDMRSVDVQGCVQFSLQYDPSKKELNVLIIQCRDLTPAQRKTSNPYIKCYLLPDKTVQGKRKSKVKKKTLEPFFNETLKYKVERSELQSRVLNLSVWHRGSLGRNIFLGEVEVDLVSWDWSKTQPSWFNLQPRTPLSPDFLCSRGRISVALKYVPQGAEGLGLPPTGELHVWIKEARQLVPHKAGNVSTFVKCFVLPDSVPSNFQNTRVIPHSLHPMFNHTMVYDGFSGEDLKEACVECTIWDQGKIGSRSLGGIRLSTGKGSSYETSVSWMDSTVEEKAFWESVINNPGEWVEAVLPLRQNLTSR